MATKKAAAKPFDVDKFVQEVAIGRHDVHLVRILEAGVQRHFGSGGGIRWTINNDTLDVHITEGSLRVADMERAEKLTGRSWLTIDPRKSAADAIALCRAYLEGQGHDPDDAATRVGDLTVEEMTTSVGEEFVEVDPSGPNLTPS